MDNAGIVDVYCNVHSKMRASILVVPNATFTRVDPEGRFNLERVPVGSRKVVIWSPTTKPVEKTVEVTASGVDLNVALEPQPETAHNNKLGQPYGSYD